MNVECSPADWSLLMMSLISPSLLTILFTPSLFSPPPLLTILFIPSHSLLPPSLPPFFSTSSLFTPPSLGLPFCSTVSSVCLLITFRSHFCILLSCWLLWYLHLARHRTVLCLIVHSVHRIVCSSCMSCLSAVGRLRMVRAVQVPCVVFSSRVCLTWLVSGQIPNPHTEMNLQLEPFRSLHKTVSSKCSISSTVVSVLMSEEERPSILFFFLWKRSRRKFPCLTVLSKMGASQARMEKDRSHRAEGDGCCWRWRHLEGGI